MKHNMLMKGAFILALGCCLSGCGKDDEGKDEVKTLTSIKVDPSSLSMLVGEKKSITATPEPADVKATFTWTSTHPSIATVSQTGEVTGVAEGTTTITISSGAVNTVVSIEVSDVYLTGIDVDFTSLTLFIYDEAELDAKPVPANAVDGDIFYRTSNAEVATVDANGKVLALKAGTATIEAYHLNIKTAVEVTV
ncbi:MAG: Ig-like domain-containing protein, partial [Bacteroidales bacterium]|nr:Ig-like domain-containing protein [Bacteroidales bacterium]